MDKVRMTHPDLPDQPIDVLPIAVPQHEDSGWVVEKSSHDDGTRQVAAQTATQQPPAAGKPSAPKSGPNTTGSDA